MTGFRLSVEREDAFQLAKTAGKQVDHAAKLMRMVSELKDLSNSGASFDKKDLDLLTDLHHRISSLANEMIDFSIILYNNLLFDCLIKVAGNRLEWRL